MADLCGKRRHRTYIDQGRGLMCPQVKDESASIVVVRGIVAQPLRKLLLQRAYHVWASDLQGFYIEGGPALATAHLGRYMLMNINTCAWDQASPLPSAETKVCTLFTARKCSVLEKSYHSNRGLSAFISYRFFTVSSNRSLKVKAARFFCHVRNFPCHLPTPPK